jgi:hypothetical protein
LRVGSKLGSGGPERVGCSQGMAPLHPATAFGGSTHPFSGADPVPRTPDLQLQR